MSETTKMHKEKAPKTLNYGIYICSTSRYKLILQGEKEVSDVGGDTIVQLLKNANQNVLFKKIVPDDDELISDAAQRRLGDEGFGRDHLFRRHRHNPNRRHHRKRFPVA